MNGRAYYNDVDPFCCAVLAEFIADGLIMPGDIDNRSITDISPDDLVGYERVHLFAGFGIWDLALQDAGWPRGRRVWTGSCPCPPFSQAGKKQHCPSCDGRDLVWCPRRTGFAICAACRHAWFADARHLWPEMWRLAAFGRPECCFGEQVASADGLGWLAGVQASMEILAYAFGRADYPAAGVGSPNIRQRIKWVANANASRCGSGRAGEASGRRDQTRVEPTGFRDAGRLADADGGLAGDGHLQRVREHGQQPQDGGAGIGMADTGNSERRPFHVAGENGRDGADIGRPQAHIHPGACGAVRDGLEHPARDGRQQRRTEPSERSAIGGRPDGSGLGDAEGGERRLSVRQERREDSQSPGASSPNRLGDAGGEGLPQRPQPADGRGTLRDEGASATSANPWAQSAFVPCSDGNWRRVPINEAGEPEPLLFPLAHAGTVRNRVGTLRGAGNAINFKSSSRFISAFLETEGVGG